MIRITSTKRRYLLGFLFVIALAAMPIPGFTANPNGAKELRVGYQKYGTLVILKAEGALEGRITFDQPIRLRRPRARGSAAFAAIEDRILRHVLRQPGADSAPPREHATLAFRRCCWAI